MTVATDKIRDARKNKRLTQQDLADKLGIPRSSYAIKEKTGDFTTAEIETLTKCLEILEDKKVSSSQSIIDIRKPNNHNEELSGKYSALLERVLDQEIKGIKTEIKTYFEDLEKKVIARLDKLETNSNEIQENQRTILQMIDLLQKELAEWRMKTPSAAQPLVDKFHKELRERVLAARSVDM